MNARVIKGVQISGSFGPNAVIKKGGKRAINIAGGSVSGDVYQEVSESEADPFDLLERQIAGMDIEDGRKEDLKSIVPFVREQLARGSDADCGLMEVLLVRLREMNPEIFRLVAQIIIERSASTGLRRLAIDMLPRVAS